jgi:hypothetical protein
MRQNRILRGPRDRGRYVTRSGDFNAEVRLLRK